MYLLPPILSTLMMAAHFSRVDNDRLAIFCLALPFLLFIKKIWVKRVYQILLVIGGPIWIERTVILIRTRQETGESWMRLAVILITVALFTIFSSLSFETKKARKRYAIVETSTGPIVYSFFLTAILLSFVHWKVDYPTMLLAERFLPGTGWVEILLLAFYAAWITEKMLDIKKSPTLRKRIWAGFSFVFFAQFILGLAGIEKFLMTGELHFPIPAVILGGPLYRGEGFFMLILFLGTVLFIGSAWCSHLCYIGAWDNLFACSQKKPSVLPRWRHRVRIGILVFVLSAGIGLRLLGISGAIAAASAIVFGLLGVGIMIFFSRKKGTMVHCTVYCPTGLVADWLGKASPFRIRIDNKCDDCGACTFACRYNALEAGDIQKRKAGITCSLCGDCVQTCGKEAINYKFFGLLPQTARSVFIVLIVSLHAVFLGLARL
jgi:NAD-dependent dihydropyrimidine dehydrogenase PreA subunit